uniref:F-box domain-containing protein n=1 Tax=Globodera pallida TaxID=36090 RepID=A0A183CD63_GLOPA
MPIEGQMSSTSACKNGIFRRAQSLRFPRSSATMQQHHGTFSPGTSSSPSTSLNRHGSRAYRSKSSRHRYGSIEVQSLLSRMSSSQRLALCSTWRQMRHQLTTLMRKILVELEQHEPEVKDIFYKAQYVDCFASASSSGNLATLDEHILAHSSGLSAEVWEKLGEIAMEKFCAVEAVQKTREAGRAWRTLIAFLTDKIRCGFEGEAKAFCRRPSNDQQQQQNTTENGTGAETDDGGAVGGRCEMLGRRLQQLRTTDSDWTPAEGPNRHGGTTAPANGRVRHE